MNAISRSAPAVRLQVQPPATPAPWSAAAPHPMAAQAVEVPAYRLAPRARPVQGTLLTPLFALLSDSIGKALRLRGFHHRTVSTPYAKMHAIDAQGWGPLPTVVVLPGFGAEAGEYVKLLWRLLPHCQRVLALDPPGHGRSELPDTVSTEYVGGAISDTIATLVDGPFILIGHSAGGYNALRYTLRHPERVLGLVLAAPAGGPFSVEEEAYYSRLLSVPTWADAQDLTRRTWGRVPLLNTLLTAGTYAHLSAPPLRALVDSDLLRLWLRPEELQSIQCPLLYMWAEKEALLPAHFYDYFRDNLPPHSEVEVMAGLSHATVLDGRHRVTDRVLQFCYGMAASLQQAYAPQAPAAYAEPADLAPVAVFDLTPAVQPQADPAAPEAAVLPPYPEDFTSATF